MEGLSDARDSVFEHWASHLTWLRPPILVTGEVTGSGFEDELLVGFTRLGNLLGLLDRQEVPEDEAASGVGGRGESVAGRLNRPGTCVP